MSIVKTSLSIHLHDNLICDKDWIRGEEGTLITEPSSDKITKQGKGAVFTPCQFGLNGITYINKTSDMYRIVDIFALN